MELVLVGLFRGIEFDDSALQDVEEIKEEDVIGLLLMPSSKTRVNRH